MQSLLILHMLNHLFERWFNRKPDPTPTPSQEPLPPLSEEMNRQNAKDAKVEEEEVDAWFDRGNRQYEAGDFEGAIAAIYL